MKEEGTTADERGAGVNDTKSQTIKKHYKKQFFPDQSFLTC
jgi:hypothetical protein